VGATFPSGTNGVSGVAVTWTTTGRPAGTGPAHPSTFLKLSDGGCPTNSTTATTCTWAWPADLEAPGSTVVLNGAYGVVPCSGISAAPICPQPGAAPAGLGMAVPPAPPGQARATGPSSSVTVSWAPGAEPDLAGYQVTRNNVQVFACNLHGAPLAGSVPCGPSLSFHDSPGGAVSYRIVAERFSVDSDPSHYLASAPATVSVAAGSVAIPGLPPVPAFGVPSFSVPGAPPSTGSAGALTGAGPGVGSAPTTTVDPGAGGLEFGAKDPAAALGPAGGAGAGHVTNLANLALIAAGLLILAVAGHLLYLREAVARYQLARGGVATRRGAHRRVRPPMQIQWGGWPPVVRKAGDLSPRR
jgi:hypothetical protein